MTLQDQVCSLPLAKRLKELGVKQESLFCWVLFLIVNKGHPDFNPKWELRAWSDSFNFRDSRISAFSVAELGEMLSPLDNEIIDIETYKEISTSVILRSMWCCSLTPNNFQKIEYYTQDSVEANARAKMLIYLLENNLIPNENASP